MIATKNGHFYTFEVKRASSGYSYISKFQINKLFEFLQVVPIAEELKHAIIAITGGKRWRFFEITEEKRKKVKKNFKIHPDYESEWNPKTV